MVSAGGGVDEDDAMSMLPDVLPRKETKTAKEKKTAAVDGKMEVIGFREEKCLGCVVAQPGVGN
jgi:hypothetical protein